MQDKGIVAEVVCGVANFINSQHSGDKANRACDRSVFLHALL